MYLKVSRGVNLLVLTGPVLNGDLLLLFLDINRDIQIEKNIIGIWD